MTQRTAAEELAMAPIRSLALPLACALVLAGQVADAQSFPFTAHTTWYDGVDGGHCSFGSIDTVGVPFGLIAAVGTPLYADSAVCGRFIEIDASDATCPGPPCGFTGNRVVVMISDQLFSTQPDLDLSGAAFGELAAPVAGLLQSVQWCFVPGTHPGNIRFVSTAGMNPWFLHFVLHDHNLGIAQVEVRDARPRSLRFAGGPARGGAAGGSGQRRLVAANRAEGESSSVIPGRTA